MAPSPAVKHAARMLLAYVRREIARGMSDENFHVSRPAALHDELKHFLDVYDYPKARKGRRP
ncbi:MAG TPA: hypothetical protein VGY48_15770 [Vicinamibacterales bacterium]|jgi:hypothetical protein|nr:hypothetical protein [Vicinamibacterales bacterium]